MVNSGFNSESTRSGIEEQNLIKDVEPGTRKPGSKAQGRKRTKTGCLTCRKRRIKCGEERPTCQNCYKSKRQCEGYNQRVVFKDPLNAYRGPHMSASAQVSFPDPIVSIRQGGDHASAAIPLPIAPRPIGLSNVVPVSTDESSLPSTTSPGTERRVYSFSASSEHSTPSSIVALDHHHSSMTFDSIDRSRIPEPRDNLSPTQQATHYDFDALHVKQEMRGQAPATPARRTTLDWSAGPTTSASFFQSYPTTSTWQQPTPLSAFAKPPSHELQLNGKAEYTPLELFQRVPEHHREYYDNHLQSDHRIHRSEYVQPVPRRVQDDATAIEEKFLVEDDEEDPYDVSDEEMDEMENEDGAWQGQLQENGLGTVVAQQARQENFGLGVRTITSFIDRPNMLATYTPSPQSSPLNDCMTARLFCHFIHVTGPSLSMFERHPANPSLIFQGKPVAKSQQHIWTYTFPTLAFHSQGLLHAMLALASLHIAKLQNGPVTASLKHYAISLRRIAKSLNSPSRRGQPSTLAACMLLAFYEAWTADHQKWSDHLLGAKQLVREIDFAGMTKQIKSMKLQRRREERERRYQAEQHGAAGYYEDRTRFQETVEDVDENIVGMLMGKKLKYDQYGHIIDDDAPDRGANRLYTQRELEVYETQRDLFWWFCKHDVLQSILGGGRLFLEYDLWSHCPPRAPLGRLNSIYGTFDHLVLLMGRLADFASKDLKRKRLAMIARRDSSSASQQQFPTAQMPPFSGMVPGVVPAKLPMGFEQPRRDESPQNDEGYGMDLEAARVEAEEEWQEIRNAFSILEDHFGDNFQALGPEFAPLIQTPFGAALQYRTYGIAGIWMKFYMALIVCHRAHPSMPPAAMMATGVAARQTASFAGLLGRIAAGIVPDLSTTQQVSPGVGAALIESSPCLFVAGVQYQNAAQRAWTINRLHDIARLTGWQSALSVALGCETSWVKTGELGRGPPYTRTSERVVPDIWTSGPPRLRIDRLAEPTEERRLVIGKSDRVHYALGILGVEEDFKYLDLDNDEQAS